MVQLERKEGINRMDRIDRIKEERMKAEGGMMNNKQLDFHSSFRIHTSALLLSCLSCPSCLNLLLIEPLLKGDRA
jgi:hypothetical protein